MTTEGTVLPVCLCGCGERVATPGAKWKRGHFHRGESHLTPLPGPDDDIDLDEEMDLGEPPGVPGGGWEVPGRGWEGPDGPDGPEEFIPPDEPPADLKDAKGIPRRRIRVTATVRKDIGAKISLGLEIPGRIWAARDPYCGGTFVAQRPAIADALTDIVCDSAELVEWFTGPAGGFMKYLDLASALYPVVAMVAGHHVMHTIGGEEQGQERPDMSRYAA